MAKSFEEIVELVDTLTARDTVYKVECDELKYHLSHAYDKARTEIAHKFSYAGKWQNLSITEQTLNDAIPYELRHMYGKKFETVLDATDIGEYKDAILTLRGRFRPIYLKTTALIARQVKARRPVEKTRVVVAVRTQDRGQCPHCLRDQAVTARGMAEHGFVLQWESRRGSCPGTGKAHYGTEAGKAYQENLIINLKDNERRSIRNIAAAKVGELKPVDKKTFQTIEDPTPRQVADMVSRLEGELYGTRSAIKFYEEAVKNWVEKGTREVDVEVYK